MLYPNHWSENLMVVRIPDSANLRRVVECLSNLDVRNFIQMSYCRKLFGGNPPFSVTGLEILSVSNTMVVMCDGCLN